MVSGDAKGARPAAAAAAKKIAAKTESSSSEDEEYVPSRIVGESGSGAGKTYAVLWAGYEETEPPSNEPASTVESEAAFVQPLRAYRAGLKAQEKEKENAASAKMEGVAAEGAETVHGISAHTPRAQRPKATVEGGVCEVDGLR